MRNLSHYNPWTRMGGFWHEMRIFLFLISQLRKVFCFNRKHAQRSIMIGEKVAHLWGLNGAVLSFFFFFSMFCSHEGIFPLRYWDFSLRQLIPSGYALSYFFFYSKLVWCFLELFIQKLTYVYICIYITRVCRNRRWRKRSLSILRRWTSGLTKSTLHLWFFWIHRIF